MKSGTNKIDSKELWQKLEQKFCTDLKNDFSNKDVEGWLSHFVPNEKVNVYQYGKEAKGKEEKRKVTKIYTGNLLLSIVNGRIPAKLMAKIIFKQLTKQNYSHSEIELLGIQENTNRQNQVYSHIRFKRFNTSGEVYESAIGIYGLAEINGKWHINEMSIYDDDGKAIPQIDLDTFWNPTKATIT